MIVGVSDKLLNSWLKDKDYMSCSDEGEAVGIAGGYWLATGEKATVFMSADGFMNALNPLTSWVIPEKIEMNLIISTGRMEPSHEVATKILEPILQMLEEDYEISKRVNIEFVRKES